MRLASPGVFLKLYFQSLPIRRPQLDFIVFCELVRIDGHNDNLNNCIIRSMRIGYSKLSSQRLLSSALTARSAS